MSWDERSSEWANVLFQPVPVAAENGHMRERGIRMNREAAMCQTAFMRGGKWQRGALLADDVIERAARAIARAENADYWAEEIDRWEQSEEWERKAYPEEYPGMAYEDRGQFREAARAALTAALGIEGEQ